MTTEAPATPTKRSTLKLKTALLPVPVPAPAQASPAQSEKAIAAMEADRIAREERERCISEMLAGLKDMLTTQPALQLVKIEDGRELFRPLAIETRDTLTAWLGERFPNATKTRRVKAANKALGKHVQSKNYIQGLVHFSQRVTLDGQAVQEVIEPHQAHARRRLEKKKPEPSPVPGLPS